MILSTKFKKHIINVSLLGLTFFCASLCFLYYLFPQFILQIQAFVVFYFAFFSIIQFYFLQKIIDTKPKLFYTEYMKWFGLRFLCHMIFILTYVLTNRADALVFVLYFCLCYLVFMIYDVFTSAFKSK